MTRIHASILTSVMAFVVGCGGEAPQPPSQQIGDLQVQTPHSTAIINGTPVASNLLGVVEVMSTTTATSDVGPPGTPVFGSGTQLNQGWVLTAQHVVTGLPTGAAIPTSGTQVIIPPEECGRENDTNCPITVPPNAIFLNPNYDVALLNIGRSYSSPSTGLPYANPLYPDSAFGLSGSTVLCEGYGLTSENFITLAGSGYGTLRYAYLQVGGSDPNVTGDVDVTPTGILASGDSGGPCFTFAGGAWNVISVVSGVTVDQITGVVEENYSVAVDVFRDWAEGVMGNAVSVFAQDNYAGTGLLGSQQLVPGGPTDGQYSSAMLTVGSNNINSWMAPLDYPWVSFLYDSSNDPVDVYFGGGGVGAQMFPDVTPNETSAVVAGDAVVFSGASFTDPSIMAPSAGLYSFAAQQVNSLTVPSGWSVSFYNTATPYTLANTFTEGNYGTTNGNSENTMVVQEPAAIYSGTDYTGPVTKFAPGCYSPNQYGSMTNLTGQIYEGINSLFVPAGLTVELSYAGIADYSPYYNLFETSSVSNLQATEPSLQTNSPAQVCVYSQPLGCTLLSPGQALVAGQAPLMSCDGRFQLWMAADGNLGVYFAGVGGEPLPGNALWNSRTGGLGQVAVMQNDGNFVLYDHQGLALQGYGAFGPAQGTKSQPAGELPSGTQGNPGAYLWLQDDGNLVVYEVNPTTGVTSPGWATNTCCH